MSRRLFLATFDSDVDILAAVRTARERRFRVVDVYTPCPVHGLSAVLGLPPSRLSRICLLSGLTGTALMTYFQFWATAITWPINIGGKPWNSLPAFMPPIFETMILFSALATVAAFIVNRRLAPGREPAPFVRGATDRAFVLAVEENDVLSDAAAVLREFSKFNVRTVETRQAGDV